ncbi:hypothetical protein [Labilibaculum euxinus]
MKNIYKLLIALVVLVGSSELTKAQSTYELPYPGATHTYQFDNVVGTSTTDWFVSRDAAVGATAIVGGASADFVISAVDGTGTSMGTDGVLTGTGVSKVSITWNGTASGTYYVFLNVSDGTCSNLKGYKVVVQTGEFNALIADVTGSATPGTVDTSVANDIKSLTCPDETTISPIVNEGTPSLGTSDIVYRVNREFTNTTNGWKVVFDALVAGASIKEVKDAAGTTIADASGYIVDGTQDYILVTVTVTNAISTPDFTLTINSAGTIDIITNASDNDATDNDATHQFNDMPTIGNISGI